MRKLKIDQRTSSYRKFFENKKYTEKSSIKFTEYINSRRYKRSRNKELYHFRNFYEIMNSLEITTKVSRLIPKQFSILSEKFRKLYNSLFRDRLYPRLLNYFFARAIKKINHCDLHM